MSNKVIIRNRNLKDLDILSKFKNLWILDLSNNLIECVNGLNCFVVMGYLNLSNNRLSWKSLENIKDLYIIYLELHGNMLLENDQQYRQQIIDIFPRLFCLDGKFINAIERKQIKIFFERSNFNKIPIRRHLKEVSFRPTSVKSLRLYGRFNEFAFDFLSQFPNNIPLNEEWDKKKIRYISQCLVSSFLVNEKETIWIIDWVDQLTNKIDNGHSISDLYVVLILFMANIEFGLERDICEKALENNQMDISQYLNVCSYFTLKNDEKLLVLSVFLAILSIANAKPKIQAECVVELYHAMQNLIWIQIRCQSTSDIDCLTCKYKSKKLKNINCLSKSLIAAEAFMILSKVDSFFENLSSTVFNDIIDYATGQENFIQKIKCNMDDEKLKTSNLVRLVLIEIQINVQYIFSSKEVLLFDSNSYINNNSLISTKSAHKINNISENLTRGHSTLGKRSDAYQENDKIIEIGDSVILGSQVLATVLAVPEKCSAIVQIQRPQVNNLKRISRNVFQQNIEKINPNSFEWNYENGFWIPSDSVGDKIFLSKTSQMRQSAEDIKCMSGKRPLIDLSMISLCEENDTLNPPKEDNKNIENKAYNEDSKLFNTYRDWSSSTKPSPRQRNFASPNFVKIDLSEINNCLKIDTEHKPMNFIPQSPYSYPSPASSMFSSRPTTVTKDARLWLGNGDYLYKKVRWHSKNPQNMIKRVHIPGWINKNTNYKSPLN